MTAKGSGTIRDEVIREALRRELDGIEAPPAEAAWRRISAALAEGRTPAARRRFGWSRYSTIAAVLLVFFLGVCGVYRAIQFRDFGQAETAGFQAEPGADVAVPEEEGAEAFGSRTEKDQGERAAGWPPELYGGFIFDRPYPLDSAGETALAAALYRSEGAELLWVRGPAGGAATLQPFLDELSGLLDSPLKLLEETRGGAAVAFTCYGHPGLAWLADGTGNALWVYDGTVPEEVLLAVYDRLR